MNIITITPAADDHRMIPA